MHWRYTTSFSQNPIPQKPPATHTRPHPGIPETSGEEKGLLRDLIFVFQVNMFLWNTLPCLHPT
jgi:hypothetical protein